MEIVKQLSILAANQPGTLANICGSLLDEKINIQGLMVLDHTDHTLIRIVVDKSNRAMHLLGEAGLLVMESELLKVELKDGPGALEDIARVLGEENLNIDYLYATEPRNHSTSTVFMRTGDDQKAIKVLRARAKGSEQ